MRLALLLIVCAASGCQPFLSVVSQWNPTVNATPPVVKETQETMTQDADQLIAALDDPNPQVRSQAALTLHRMNHPKALDACLKTLDDGEDILHLDLTPSVGCLIDIGQPALRPLLDYLLADDDLTRLRAQRAVEGITTRLFGFDGRDFPEGQLAAWRAWWAEIGYDSDASPAARQQAVDRLRAWVETQ